MDPHALTASSRSLSRRFEAAVAHEFEVQPLGSPGPPITETDLAHLPDAVRRYLRRSGVIGRPAPQNMRVVLDADMYRKPGQAPMRAQSVQYTFFGRPTRIFLMRARMFGVPVRALHIHRDGAATFTVRAASLVTMVDQSGPQISAAETVTVLNDMCLMAPGSLLDPRLAWSAIDATTARVVFTNGSHTVSATIEVNDDGELVTFWSDDRPDSSSGEFVPMRWSTPVTQYRDVDGLHLMHRGGAVYDRPDGPFMYGDFTVRSLAYDVTRQRRQ